MSDKKVFITGINGFVGEHAAREFKNRGYSVSGVGHDTKPNEKIVDIIDEYISCDLTDAEQVDAKISLTGISAFIHLAGLGSIGQSFQQPRRYITENGLMTYNILQRAADDNMPGRVVVVSTGALYNPNQPLPLLESSETSPNSPYAVGKLMTEDVTRYFRSRDVDAILVRPFNHIGPGQNTGFILPDLFEQLSQAKDKLLVGNIDTKRDYTDVRDIARAYSTLALAPSLNYDLYNICSGKSMSGRELLEQLKKSMAVTNVAIEVDQSKIRPNDIMEIVGDSSRLQNELGWKPEISITQTIQDFIASKKS